VENSEGKRPLGGPRCRWEDNIKINLRETAWSGLDWTDLAEDRDQWSGPVNTVMNLWLPQNIEKFLSSWASGGVSRRRVNIFKERRKQTLSYLYYLLCKGDATCFDLFWAGCKAIKILKKGSMDLVTCVGLPPS
jgi:hypothetical protein